MGNTQYRFPVNAEMKDLRVEMNKLLAADLVKYPEAGYYFSQGNVVCTIDRNNKNQYLGTIRLKPNNKYFNLPYSEIITNHIEDIYETIIKNVDERAEYEFTGLGDEYENGFRYIHFRFWYLLSGDDRIYYPFDRVKLILTAIAKFFNK